LRSDRAKANFVYISDEARSRSHFHPSQSSNLIHLGFSLSVSSGNRAFENISPLNWTDVRARLHNFTALFYGCAALCPSFPHSIFALYDNVRWEMNIYDARPPRPVSPRGKNLRVPNSRRSRRRNSLRIKLQIYGTAAPHRAARAPRVSSWMRTGERTAPAIVHVSCTRPEFVRLPRKPIWTLDSPSREPSPKWMEQHLSAQGFRHQTLDRIGKPVRTRLERSAIIWLLDC